MSVSSSSATYSTSFGILVTPLPTLPSPPMAACAVSSLSAAPTWRILLVHWYNELLVSLKKITVIISESTGGKQQFIQQFTYLLLDYWKMTKQLWVNKKIMFPKFCRGPNFKFLALDQLSLVIIPMFWNTSVECMKMSIMIAEDLSFSAGNLTLNMSLSTRSLIPINEDCNYCFSVLGQS